LTTSEASAPFAEFHATAKHSFERATSARAASANAAEATNDAMELMRMMLFSLTSEYYTKIPELVKHEKIKARKLSYASLEIRWLTQYKKKTTF
jgi:hypothetical protein